MKITLVYAAAAGLDFNLRSAVKVVTDTLKELGETLGEFNLYIENFPYYDGQASAAVKKMMTALKKSDGIIFAFTANLFAPTACMQNFLEYLLTSCAGGALKDKNIFVIAASERGGEAEALNYTGKAIRFFGGFDAVRLGLNGELLKNIDTDTALRECIEKYAEDYYRVIRQNRKYILPLDFTAAPPAAIPTAVDYENLLEYDKQTDITPEDLAKKYNLDAFTEKQADDIEEITRFFAGKYKETENITPNSHISARLASPAPAPVPRTKTLKQNTQSLVHYFQPQLAAGLSAVIQISISGKDGFDGYLTIDGSECEYTDGTAESADITIMCDPQTWQGVLSGKHSANKAFLVGYLKVRGNFVLLTKFDSVFKLGG